MLLLGYGELNARYIGTSNICNNNKENCGKECENRRREMLVCKDTLPF
jgi:hypothetical protein